MAQVRWLGHGTFLLTSEQEKTILIDPWLRDNPAAPEDAKAIDTADIVLITHDHFDHMGNIDQIKKAGTVVGQPEIIGKVKEMTDLSEDNLVNGGGGMNIGGSVEIDGIKVTMVEATHSSDVGSPAGFFVTLEDGKTIYHAGDTGLFSNMGVYGELFNPDLALLPIGDVFTMDSQQAAKAVELLNPKVAIPMHYGTFPILTHDGDEFVRLVGKRSPGVKTEILQPGETYEL